MLTLTSTGRQSCTLQSRFLNSLSDTHTLPPASATDNGKAVLCSFLWVPNPPAPSHAPDKSRPCHKVFYNGVWKFQGPPPLLPASRVPGGLSLG